MAVDMRPGEGLSELETLQLRYVHSHTGGLVLCDIWEKQVDPYLQKINADPQPWL